MRGREGDRRAAPARGDWGDHRDRDRSRGLPNKNGRRSRSRSPIKSKLMALAMSTGGRDSIQGVKPGDRYHRDNSRDRERLQKGRLRMDELDGKRFNMNTRSPPEHRRSDAGMGQRNKPGSSLDKVVKKAREERSNYWDKKVLEAEEKDPDRWGHSGFKELYHKKDVKKIFPNKRKRSHSGSPKRGIRSRSGSPMFGRRQSHSRSRSPSFSRHRSRSPIQRIAKSRKDLRSFSRSLSPVPPIKRRLGLMDKSKVMTAKKSATNSGGSKSNGAQDLRNKALRTPNSGLLGGKGNSAKSKSSAIPSKNRSIRRSSSFSSSGSSVSRSPSRSKLSHLTSAKKGNSGGRPLSKLKGGRQRQTAASDSYSSSTSSSDEDVLQLHAKDKERARSSSFSRSDSQSSSSSRSIGGQAGGMIRRASSYSSSSESQTSSDSDSDISIRAKPKPNQKIALKNNKAVGAPKKLNPTPAKNTTTPTAASTVPAAVVAAQGSATSNKVTVTKKAAETSKSVKVKSGSAANTAKPATTSKSKLVEKEKTAMKKGSESGETESESESDSDSEPRMTLSERFAKLSQMSTDKREMAKPVLSVNEIDTKMRVVKDFRNPEVPKVFHAVDPSTSGNRTKPASRNPPTFPEESSRRDMPDDRHQHFERMYRDVPAEQPLDWSDPRVRFNYYKDRGCFDERPITFDEYIKWEDWYHKYREWLEQEAYYSQQQQQGGRPSPNPGNRMHMKGVGGFPLGRRMDQTPMASASGPPMSSRPHFGRPEDTSYLQAHERVGRRIDRTAGGSLVVNIRPYNNNGGGGGFQTRRHIRRPE